MDYLIIQQRLTTVDLTVDRCAFRVADRVFRCQVSKYASDDNVWRLSDMIERKSEKIGSTNAVERAYAHLHAITIRFGYRPGQRINEVELASSLGMSRAPVREALNRLVVDGLVTMEPQRGFSCRKLSATEIIHLYEIRTDLELPCVRRACSIASADEISALATIWSATERGQAAMDLGALVDADESFHLKIASFAGNPERVRILSNINSRVRFVRIINLESELRRTVSLAEHTRLLEAIARRETEEAVELMRLHLQCSSEEIKRHINTGLTRIYADEVA